MTIGVIAKLPIQEGKTAIVVTHDPRIFAFADRICHMDNGRLVQETSPAAADAEA